MMEVRKPSKLESDMLDEIKRLRSANRSLGSELMTERTRVAELELDLKSWVADSKSKALESSARIEGLTGDFDRSESKVTELEGKLRRIFDWVDSGRNSMKDDPDLIDLLSWVDAELRTSTPDAGEKAGDDAPLCERCKWPLADSVENGCVPGNCSQRPLPPLPDAEEAGRKP